MKENEFETKVKCCQIEFLINNFNTIDETETRKNSRFGVLNAVFNHNNMIYLIDFRIFIENSINLD